LQDILNEWVNGGPDYADRVDHLRNGGGLNTALLNEGTVFDDGLANLLRGSSGYDLWFVGTADLLYDYHFTENQVPVT
jgi:hypothetical protein